MPNDRASVLTKHKLLLLIVMYVCNPQPSVAGNLIGWIEPVSLINHDFELVAKIDTGADNSSIDTSDWKAVERGGKTWIQFAVTSNDDRSTIIDAPLIRYTEIKRKGAKSVSRPVVSLEVCLHDQRYEIPVNLAERGNFKYRMLVGRSALAGRFIVDSSIKRSTSPVCQ